MKYTFQIQSLKIKEYPILFEDYLYRFEKVSRFYQWNYHTDWEPCIKLRERSYQNRSLIQRILLEQNRKWNATFATMNNIKKLSHPNTLAVVTGQQAGIFGGPLYTAYKILTAVKLAEQLQDQFSQYQFVPIFWMEVSDGDFQEINHFYCFDKSNQLHCFTLKDQPEDFRPIHFRQIPDEIEQIYERLVEICLKTEFRDTILEKMRKIYHPGKSLADAFAEWLIEMFGDYGLIVFNPEEKGSKHLAAPLFRKAFYEWKQVNQIFQQISEKLKSTGYHNQIILGENQTLLFYLSDNLDRSRVDRDENRFLVRHPQNHYPISDSEINFILNKSPERFSPNVALRPIVQDYLLPTVAYIGGPAEISYLAQLKELYHFFGVNQPIFYPRVRMTLVEKRIHRLVQKFGYDYHKIFELKENLLEEFIRQHSDKYLKDKFDQIKADLYRSMIELNDIMIEIDPTLQSAIQKTQNQIDNAFNKFFERADKAFERKMETEVRQLKSVISNLFPNGKYQERILNLFNYLVKYGPDFISNLYDSLPVETDLHKLVFL